jgi:hypothetical protein
MARSVSFKEIICGDYSSQHIAQLVRSAKQRAELKGVEFAGYDTLLEHTLSELLRNGFRCECCGTDFQRHANGKGGGGKKSLSLHRVKARFGYIPSNIKVICQSCNNAIGETNTLDDVEARFKALHWQTTIMEN